MRSTPLVCLVLAAFTGCGGPDLSTEEAVTELLTPRQQLIRVSVDLRGVHPSEADLAAVDANPGLYGDFVDEYMLDPRFRIEMEDMYNRVLRTRTGDTYFDPAMAGLDPDDLGVADSIGTEPLKLIGHVIDQDLPFTEIVLAEYTFADSNVAAMWDLQRESGSGWTQATYRDGRPMAGVLSSTTLWQRYPSSGVNANRHRANQVSRMFLCDDYLTRPLEFTRNDTQDLADADPQDVINQSDTCQSCHSTLDPLGAHFFGFWWERDVDSLSAMRTYRPQDELLWESYAGRAPGYFGNPTTGVRELGSELAADVRFSDCAVETAVEGLMQYHSNDADWSDLQRHRAAFETGGLVYRDLIRSVVSSDAYRAKSFVDDTGERIPVVKTVSPRQLANIIEDKTGYVLSFDGVDALRTNDMGLATLAGGIDGRFIVNRSYEPSVSSAFVHERLSQAAGFRVAAHDLNPARTEDATLLVHVSVNHNPETHRVLFEQQIMHLHRTVLGLPIEADSPQIEESIALWKQIYSVTSSPTTAWAGVITATLRSPRILFY